MTLVEPRRKRVSFLKQVIRTLGLKDVVVVPERLEKTTGPPPIGPFSMITCRAFTSIDAFLEMVEGYCLPGGRVFFMKGPAADNELEKWRQTQTNSPFQLEAITEGVLPFSKARRQLLVFTKTGAKNT